GRHGHAAEPIREFRPRQRRQGSQRPGCDEGGITMKKSVFVLMLTLTGALGCLNPNALTNGQPAPTARARRAEQPAPPVNAASVTPDNAAEKAEALEEELDRETRGPDSLDGQK